MTIRKIASFVAGCLCAAAVSPAAATVWWVNPIAGVNSGPCGSVALPCKTLQFAIDRSSPDDTVRAKAGTYNESVTVTLPITLLADAFATSGNRNATIIDCVGICDAGSGNYLPAVSLFNGATLTGFTVRNSGGTGIEGSGSVVITQNVVTGNSGFATSRGGGIAVYSSTVFTSTSPLRVENNDVFGNSAPELGGGIFVWSKSRADRALRPVIVQNNTIHDNSTDLSRGRGGGIYVRAEGVNGGQTNITITQNTIEGNSNTAGPDTIYYPWGGGISAGAYGYGTHNLSITNNTIEGNDATVGGGVALFTNLNSTASAVFNFSGNTVRNNVALDPSGLYGFGGGLFVYTFGFGTESVTVENNQLTGNTARVFGGGMDARSAPAELGSQVVTVRDNVVTGNKTNEWGGGIFALLGVTDVPATGAATLEVLDNTVTSNTCSGVLDTGDPTGRGGGIFAISTSNQSTVGGANLVVRGNDVRSNRANLAGGGINLSTVSSSLADPDDPASLPAAAQALLYADHNLVAGNLAASPDVDNFPASGGGVFVYTSAEGQSASSIFTDFNTVAENSSDIGAGGFEIESYTTTDELLNNGVAAVVFSNSIVSENIGFGAGGPVPGDPGVITLGGTGNLSVNFFYNDFYLNSDGDFESWLPDPTGSNGNLSVTPALNAAFAPTTCSATMDAADPAADYSLETPPSGARANMGHQGGTAASAPSLADINGDNMVDGVEILRIATSFASVSPGPRYSAAADLDSDGDVDGDDLSYMAAQFGTRCP